MSPVHTILDVLESPWPRREEAMLRGWFNSSEYQDAALARFLIGQILETGLEPSAPPRLLPPIKHADIDLLCWMGIECEGPTKPES